MSTVHEQWVLFERMVVPKSAGESQRLETRRAFYAGAEAMARILMVISAEGVSEDAGVQMLEGCHDELRRFARLVAEGKA